MSNIITEEIKNHCIEHSTERWISKDFPEYQKFFTGKVEFRKAQIVNVNPYQTIDVVEEIKGGGVGDIIETYVNLVREEKSFWRNVKEVIFGLNKRHSINRMHLIADLKKALNIMKVNW
jgi:hypothetical protein